MRNILRQLWEQFSERQARWKQTTFCYCPTCKNELCGDNQTICYDGGTFVTYDCGKCHTESIWDFDAPAPLLISSQAKS